MKRILSIVLAFLLMSGCGVIAEDAEKPVMVYYTYSNWAEEYVSRAADFGWVDIPCDFTEEITREEFCVITQKVMRELGETSLIDFEVPPFEDTGEDAVLYLYGLDIIEGKAEGVFAPDDLLTREEAAVIFERICAFWAEKGKLQLPEIMLDFAYSDDGEISDWAKNAVYAMATHNIMQGTDIGFEPKNKLTREEGVIMLLRLYDKCKGELFADRLNSLMPRDKNYMFSPLSVKMAFALAANGAEGETKNEICRVLDIESLEEFNKASKDLIEKYSRSDFLRFDIANSIWINKSNTKQSFGKEYIDCVREYYNAEAGEVTDKDAAEVINGWINDKTNGKIQGVVQDSAFWAMIVNAIYFKGMWDDEFPKSATKPDVFTSADGTESKIDFMNQTGWFSYADTGKSKIIELPYKSFLYYLDENGEEQVERNRDLSASMYIIMADEEVNVQEELNKADVNYKNTYVKLSMPKFEIEYSAPMGKMLKDMGIEKAFSQDAEFDAMFDEGSMFISDVLHKTYIKVDEEGTEAAAVTAIALAGAAMPPQPIEFKADKPFYFAVKASDEILFMGRYAYAE